MKISNKPLFKKLAIISFVINFGWALLLTILLSIFNINGFSAIIYISMYFSIIGAPYIFLLKNKKYAIINSLTLGFLIIMSASLCLVIPIVGTLLLENSSPHFFIITFCIIYSFLYTNIILHYFLLASFYKPFFILTISLSALLYLIIYYSVEFFDKFDISFPKLFLLAVLQFLSNITIGFFITKEKEMD